jgi:hypothetical protein
MNLRIFRPMKILLLAIIFFCCCDKLTTVPRLSLLFAFEFSLSIDWKIISLHNSALKCPKLSFHIVLRELTEYSVELVLFLITFLSICRSFIKHHTANRYFPWRNYFSI